jgi:hypothetical protein
MCQVRNVVDTTMLCRPCQKIRPPHRDDGKSDERGHWCPVKHHSTFDNLLASAGDGCELCVVFRPFVQSAKSKAAERYASCKTENEDNTLHSGCFQNDPFEYLCGL